jgi:hypothetical protein
MSGETSACACVVTGSKHATPSAAAKIEAFTTIVIFIALSLLSWNFDFDFIVVPLLWAQFYSYSAFASMQRGICW